jgi:hypothetical protein
VLAASALVVALALRGGHPPVGWRARGRTASHALKRLP